MVQSFIATLPAKEVEQKGPFDLKNIQGDILVGTSKKYQDYIFARIKNVGAFREQLHQIIPLVSTTFDLNNFRAEVVENKRSAKEQGVEPALLPFHGLTIGLTSTGVTKLGKDATDIHSKASSEPQFISGMHADAPALGDDPANYIDQFTSPVDVVFTVGGDTEDRLNEHWGCIEEITGSGTNASSIEVVYRLKCNERSGDQKGHEHFGFKDGVSQPAIDGFNENPLPGQPTCGPEIILLGYDKGIQVPDWVKDGSFMTFRQLKQLVPEFDQFLDDNGHDATIPKANGPEWLGARFFGRWKSGCPIVLSPTYDNTSIGNCAEKNNDFQYPPNQVVCPYAAHARRTNPRNDILPAELKPGLMLRRGVPYGEEVSAEEKSEKKTLKERGLAFTCYTSTLSEKLQGFRFVQRLWCNNIKFPIIANPKLPSTALPGFDPIVGQAPLGKDRWVTGMDEGDAQKRMTLEPFVVSQGGEYFFVPSIKGLQAFASTLLETK